MVIEEEIGINSVKAMHGLQIAVQSCQYLKLVSDNELTLNN